MIAAKPVPRDARDSGLCRAAPRAWAVLSMVWLLSLGAAAQPAEGSSQEGTAVARQAAPDKVAASVLIILAGSDGEGIDPQLANLKALKQPPFDGFKKKSLLKQVEVDLTRNQDTEVELPNGRKLRIRLLEPKPDGRFRVSVSINRPGKQDYLPLMTVVAAPGDPFFVAGQKYQGGTLIVGIRVGKAS